MTNSTTRHLGEALSFRLDSAAVVTVRMPTDDERGHGYPEGQPVMVVADGVLPKVFPAWVTLAVSSPHAAPAPDAARDALAYVLGIIGEKLDAVAALVADLAQAAESPCAIAHLAGEVRESEAAAWYCADASRCALAGPAPAAT